VLEAAAAGLLIQAEAEVVRRTDEDLWLRFSEIAERDVLLLRQLAVAFYR
jgi:hypothetical protein